MNIPDNISHLSPHDRKPSYPRTTPRPAYAPTYSESTTGAAPKRFVAKGHDSQLQDGQHSKQPVEIAMMSGALINGTISRRDKFTITLKIAGGRDAGKDLIIFKHAIESVLIDKAGE